MAIANLFKDEGLKRIYKTSDGSLVTLELKDDFSEIIFCDSAGEKFGEFEFKELDVHAYKLTRMYTNTFKGRGLGRVALEFFKEITVSKIYTSPHDGIVRDDGSHLTECAPGFVSKMIKEGLIENPYEAM